MFLITVSSTKVTEQTINELACVFNAEVYSTTALLVEKPSIVGELARYLCKVGVFFEVQPWE